MTDESLNAGLELVVSDDSVSLKAEESVEETDEFTPLSPEDIQEPIVEEEAPTEGQPVDVPLEDVSVETLDRLALYQEKLLKQASISQEDIHELKAIDPNLVTKEIGYFTEKPTRTNLDVTLEAIDKRCSAIESYLKEGLRANLQPSTEGFLDTIKNLFKSTPQLTELLKETYLDEGYVTENIVASKDIVIPNHSYRYLTYTGKELSPEAALRHAKKDLDDFLKETNFVRDIDKNISAVNKVNKQLNDFYKRNNPSEEEMLSEARRLIKTLPTIKQTSVDDKYPNVKNQLFDQPWMIKGNSKVSTLSIKEILSVARLIDSLLDPLANLREKYIIEAKYKLPNGSDGDLMWVEADRSGDFEDEFIDLGLVLEVENTVRDAIDSLDNYVALVYLLIKVSLFIMDESTGGKKKKYYI